MKTRAILTLLLLLAAACTPSSKRITDAFVMQYIQSIVDGSEFYKRYSTPQDLKLIALARPKMVGDFRVTSWDNSGGGRSEYAMSFANGAVAIVAVEEEGGVVRSATLTLSRQPSQ